MSETFQATDRPNPAGATATLWRHREFLKQGAVAVAFMGLTIVAGQYALRRLEYRTRVEGPLAQH